MTTPDITQADLEAEFGVRTVAQYFDDDGDGIAEPVIVTRFLAIATVAARDQLYASFSRSVVDGVATNERYKRLVATIALAERATTRHEWMLPDGSWPYERQKKEAFLTLSNIAKGIERMSSEEDVGGNPQLRSRRRPEARELIFAPTSKNPTGGGGF